MENRIDNKDPKNNQCHNRLNNLEQIFTNFDIFSQTFLETFFFCGSQNIFYLSKERMKQSDKLKNFNKLLEMNFDLEIIERKDNYMYLLKNMQSYQNLSNLVKKLKERFKREIEEKKMEDKKKLSKDIVKSQKEKKFKKFYSFVDYLNPYKYLFSKNKEKALKNQQIKTIRDIESKKNTNIQEELGKLCFTYANNYLKAVGKKELLWSDQLYEIALRHSGNMATKRIPFGHQDFDIRSLLIKEYHYLPCRENVAYITLYDIKEKIAERVVQGWINSEGHRLNIISQNRVSAIGAYWSEEENICYFTQLFAN